MNDTLRQWHIRMFWFLAGFIVGGCVMIWVYSHQAVTSTKPVVTVEQDGAGHAGSTHVTHSTRQVSDQQSRDAAPPLALEQQIAKAKADIEARFAQVERDHEARLVRVEQRNKEFAFAERKLAGVKTWDLKLGEVGK